MCFCAANLNISEHHLFLGYSVNQKISCLWFDTIWRLSLKDSSSFMLSFFISCHVVLISSHIFYIFFFLNIHTPFYFLILYVTYCKNVLLFL